MQYLWLMQCLKVRYHALRVDVSRSCVKKIACRSSSIERDGGGGKSIVAVAHLEKRCPDLRRLSLFLLPVVIPLRPTPPPAALAGHQKSDRGPRHILRRRPGGLLQHAGEAAPPARRQGSDAERPSPCENVAGEGLLPQPRAVVLQPDGDAQERRRRGSQVRDVRVRVRVRVFS